MRPVIRIDSSPYGVTQAARAASDAEGDPAPRRALAVRQLGDQQCLKRAGADQQQDRT